MCMRLDKTLDEVCNLRIERCSVSFQMSRLFKRFLHFDVKTVGDGKYYKHNPFDIKNAHCSTPLLPINSKNLRIPGLSGHQTSARRRGHGSKKGWTFQRHTRNRNPDPTYNHGNAPFHRRFPKWNAAIRQWRKKPLDWLGLSKIQSFLEQGRLDSRFPITQRHLNDSGAIRVRRGVHLYNTEDRPFPYCIHLDVAGADQSSINMINAVGGSVTIVYRHKLNLEAHLHPGRFEILPKTSRPDLNAIYALEKYRARGCLVHYIKPLWLIQEEEIMKSELINKASDSRAGQSNEFRLKNSKTQSTLNDWKETLLDNYRSRQTYQRRRKVFSQIGVDSETWEAFTRPKKYQTRITK